MGNLYLIQQQTPGRAWRTIAKGLTKAEAIALRAEKKATQEGVSEWDAIKFRMAADR
jgi:hypothetical protein